MLFFRHVSREVLAKCMARSGWFRVEYTREICQSPIAKLDAFPARFQWYREE
jgi:hypothetical protein